MNAADGTALWESPLDFDLGFSDRNIITVDEVRNQVYLVEDSFAPDEGKLFVIDKSTGDILWYQSWATHQAVFEGDYALFDGERLYLRTLLPAPPPDPFAFMTQEQIDAMPPEAATMMAESASEYQPEPYPDWGSVISLDPQTQQRVIMYDHPDIGEHATSASVRGLALCGDMLLAGYSDESWSPMSGPKYLVAYHVDDPAIVWEQKIDEITGNIACNPDLQRIYVPTNPFLYALDVTTGQKAWAYAGFGPIFNPSVANGVVYFLSDTNMYAINEQTGAKLFYYRLGEEAYETGQVAISGGMVYFTANGGDCDMVALGLKQDGGAAAPAAQ